MKAGCPDLTDSSADRDADIAKASVAAGRIINMRSRDQQDGRLVSLDVGNIGDNDMGVKIHFQNVWFRYPTRDVPILNGLDLTVCALCFCSPSPLTDERSDHVIDRKGAICGNCWSVRYGFTCAAGLSDAH